MTENNKTYDLDDRYKQRTYAQYRVDNVFNLIEQFRSFQLFDMFFYRGHADAKWELESSYDRYKKIKGPPPGVFFSKNYSCDSALFQGELAAIKYALATNDSFRNTRHPKIEILSEMQHYGSSTRFLDVTESLGVALFFAMAGNSGKNDVAIWAINKNVLLRNFIHAENSFTPPDDKKDYFFNPRTKKEFHIDVFHLCHINSYEFEIDFNEQLCDYAEYIIGNNDVINPPDRKLYCTVYPGVFPIRPTVFNERLHAQNGLFLLQQSLEYSFMNNLLNTLNISLSEFEKDVSSSYLLDITEEDDIARFFNTALVKFVIPPTEFKNCETVLKTMNVNYKTLFPDKYGIIKSAEKVCPQRTTC